MQSSTNNIHLKRSTPLCTIKHVLWVERISKAIPVFLSDANITYCCVLAIPSIIQIGFVQIKCLHPRHHACYGHSHWMPPCCIILTRPFVSIAQDGPFNKHGNFELAQPDCSGMYPKGRPEPGTSGCNSKAGIWI